MFKRTAAIINHDTSANHFREIYYMLGNMMSFGKDLRLNLEKRDGFVIHFIFLDKNL